MGDKNGKGGAAHHPGDLGEKPEVRIGGGTAPPDHKTGLKDASDKEAQEMIRRMKKEDAERAKKIKAEDNPEDTQPMGRTKFAQHPKAHKAAQTLRAAEPKQAKAPHVAVKSTGPVLPWEKNNI